VEFFNDLYHRFLLTTVPAMKAMCLQAMAVAHARLASVHHQQHSQQQLLLQQQQQQASGDGSGSGMEADSSGGRHAPGDASMSDGSNSGGSDGEDGTIRAATR
jgi:hypothetical protein